MGEQLEFTPEYKLIKREKWEALLAELEAARACIEDIRYFYDSTGHYVETKRALAAYDKAVGRANGG